MRQKSVKRPKVGALVELWAGRAKVVQVQNYGCRLIVKADYHGEVTAERHPNGWWTVVEYRAYGAWNQGVFPSRAAARREARAWFADPDIPKDVRERQRLWIIPHGKRWRLVNCGNRGPEPHEAPYYGPLTATNV